MENTQIIILAAGKSTRMKSEISKIYHNLAGKTILEHVVENTKQVGLNTRPVLVVNQEHDDIKKMFGDSCEYIVQEPQLGTGHAIQVCENKLYNQSKNIIVLYADMPLISSETIKNLINEHQKNNSAITMLTAKVSEQELKNTFFDFGRIIRNQNNKIIDIREIKDASEKEKKIQEVNPSIFCFKANWLWENIDKLKSENIQQEFYLTDMIKMAFKQKEKINSSVLKNCWEVIGINTLEQLEIVKKYLHEKNSGDNKLDVIDEDNNVIGQETRKKIHQEGLLHREIHVWFYNSKGEVFFQKRADDKDTFPGLLDATVGGHVEIGDSYEEAAVEESLEEAGLKISSKDLKEILFLRKKSFDRLTGTMNNVWRKIFVYNFSGGIEDLQVEIGSASGFVKYSIEKVLSLSVDENCLIIAGLLRKPYREVFEKIKKLMQKK